MKSLSKWLFFSPLLIVNCFSCTSRYLGVNLGKAKLGRFADGETAIQIVDNVRGRPSFLSQGFVVVLKSRGGL